MRNFNFLVFGNVWESCKVGAGPYLSPTSNSTVSGCERIGVYLSPWKFSTKGLLGARDWGDLLNKVPSSNQVYWMERLSFRCIILSNFSPLEECCIQSVCNYNLYVIRNNYCLIATCSMTRPTFCIPKLHLGIEHMFLLCVIHITYRCERKGRRRKLGNDVMFIDEQQ